MGVFGLTSKLIVAICPSVVAYGPLCVILYGLDFVMLRMNGILNCILSCLPSVSNSCYFVGLYGSLYVFFRGQSVIPLFTISLMLLRRDYCAFAEMDNICWLRDCRNEVLTILSLNGDHRVALFRAYHHLASRLKELDQVDVLQHGFGLKELPVIKRFKKKYFYDPNYAIVGHFVKNSESQHISGEVCCRKMYELLFKCLSLETFQTTGGSRPHPQRWKNVGFTSEFVTTLCACLPFGLGFQLNPVAGQFIQDALVHVIQIFYIMTDKRASRHAALACQLLQFRNSPLGIVLDNVANEWLRDYFMHAFTELVEVIDNFMTAGMTWEERMESQRVPVTNRGLVSKHVKGRRNPPHSEVYDFGGSQNQSPYRSSTYAEDTEFISKLMDMNAARFTPTSFDASLGGLLRYLHGFDGMLRSQVVKKLLQILAVFIALLSFCKSGEFTAEGMNRVSEAMKKQCFEEQVDMIGYFIGLLKWLAEAGWHLFRFPTATMFSPEESTLWKEQAEKLLLAEKCAGFADCTATDPVTVDGKNVPITLLRTRVLKLLKTDWPRVESALKLTSSKFVLNEFKLLKNRLIVFESVLARKVLAQKYRKQPFGIALVGGTSVGKSNVANTIFAYISALQGMEHSPEMIFSRSPMTTFWDTFVGQEYILFDDVGAVHPQSKTPDQSMADILQVSNNAPYVVPMAQADDKGTQCVTSTALIATSNVFNLGAHNMFATPAAIYRRFHVWTRMSVKPAFADTTGRLDMDKVRRFWTRIDSEGGVKPYSRQFPPYWNFTLHETGDEVSRRPFQTFDHEETSLLDYLSYIKDAFENHLVSQDRVMQSHADMSKLTLCSGCRLPSQFCRCNMPANQPVVARFQPINLVPTIGESSDDVISVSSAPMEKVSQWDSYRLWCLFSIFSLILATLYYFGCFTFGGIAIFLLYHVGILSFWTFVVLHTFVSLTRQWFACSPEACTVTDTVQIPIWAASNLWNRAVTVGHESWVFSSTLIRGGFSREAFFNACFAHARCRMKSVLTVKNGILVLLVLALGHLIREPAFRLFKTSLSMTGGDSGISAEPVTVPSPEISRLPGRQDKPLPSDFKLPSADLPLSSQEDSRSAWYNPNPKLDTRSDKSRCLDGESGKVFVENRFRRQTCNIIIERRGQPDGIVRGLAIGGTLVLTCAHAFYSYDGTKESLKNLHTKGYIEFPSLLEGRKVKSEFVLTQKNIFMNIEEDWAIIAVPSMTRRVSLVDYFLEKNHAFPIESASLKNGDTVQMGKQKLHIVNPVGIVDFESWTQKNGITLPYALVPPGYMSNLSFFGRTTTGSGTGMSGSPIVTSTGGVSILGLQTMADSRDSTIVVSTFIGRTQLKDAIAQLEGKSTLNQFASISQDYFVGEDQELPPVTTIPTRSNPLNFPGLEEYHMQLICTLRQVTGSPSSKFGHPPYREFFRQRGYVCDKEKPNFDWKSKRHYLTQVSNISSKIDFDRVDLVASELHKHWANKYSETGELKLLTPLSLTDAINGNDKITWVERLKMDTSAGYPWNTRKLELLEVRPTESRRCGYEFSLPVKLQEQFNRYFFQLIAKEPLTYPYKGTQKDEPISPEKNQTRGPRLFCAANLFVIIAGRILFGSYIRIAQRNPFVSWAAVGMNAASKIWGTLWKFISHFGSSRIIAGDYSNFDQNMSPVFTSAAYAVIIGLIISSGNYDPELINACRSWAAEAIYPTLIIDGDVFCIAGTNPSGNPLTVHVNCIVNILFIMYVWVGVGNDIKLFFVQVRMMTYGDDNLIAVHIIVTNFNYWTIHCELAKIGVKYTPADKSDPDPGKEFDKPEDIAFLKRRFEERDGFYYAPLDFSSICKTFNCWMISKEADQDHGISTFMSIWENACHYEETLCLRIHKDILACCEHFGWPTSSFLPPDEIRARFVTAEVSRIDVLENQAELEYVHQTVGLIQTVGEASQYYTGAHEEFFERISRAGIFRMGYHGLAFTLPFTGSLSRWFSFQDGAWFQAMDARNLFQVPHGPGAFPLVEAHLLEYHEEDQSDIGTFDSYQWVEGPQLDESSLPLGPC